MANEHVDDQNTIHGHQVSTNADDEHSRQYLRSLDVDEAKTIFEQAKRAGNAEFEINKDGTRHNYSAGYKDGKYTVTNKGKQKPSGWF